MRGARRCLVYLVVAVLYVVASRVADPTDPVVAPLVHLWVPLFTIAVVVLAETALWWQCRDRGVDHDER